MSVIGIPPFNDGKSYIGMPSSEVLPGTPVQNNGISTKTLLLAAVGVVTVVGVSVGVLYQPAQESTFGKYQANLDWLVDPDNVGSENGTSVGRSSEINLSLLPAGGQCNLVGEGMCDRNEDYKTLCDGKKCDWDRYRCEQACTRDSECGGFESGSSGSCRVFDSVPDEDEVDKDKKYECYECKDSFGNDDNEDSFNPRCEVLNYGECSSSDYNKRYKDYSYEKCEEKCRDNDDDCSGYEYDNQKEYCYLYSDFPSDFHDGDDDNDDRYRCHKCDTWEHSNENFRPTCDLLGKGRCDADNYRKYDDVGYAACEYRCTTHPQCSAYEFEEDDNQCKLIFESVDEYDKKYKERMCHVCKVDVDFFPKCPLVGKGRCESDKYTYVNDEKSYSECEFECRKEPQCNSYEYTARDKSCKLIFEPVTTYNDRYDDRICHTCVKTPAFEPKCDLVGNGRCDASKYEYEDDETTYAECENRCAASDTCQSYEWNKKESWCKLISEKVTDYDDKYGDRICHFCSAKPDETEFEPKCALIGNGRCDASEYEYFEDKTSYAMCEFQCGVSAKCWSYEWNQKDNECKLIFETVDDFDSKYGDRICHSCDGSINFEPTCSVIGTGRCSAKDYKYAEDGDAMPYGQCEYACRISSKCVAYEWHKDDGKCKTIFESVDELSSSSYPDRICHSCE
jgi:hypothetical protein